MPFQNLERPVKNIVTETDVERLLKALHLEEVEFVIIGGVAAGRSKLQYQNTPIRIYAKGVTPECLNRGSSSGLAWIPDRSMRE